MTDFDNMTTEQVETRNPPDLRCHDAGSRTRWRGAGRYRSRHAPQVGSGQWPTLRGWLPA